MNYQATESFINALNEWNEVTGDYKACDFQSLIFTINFQIGSVHRIAPDDTAEKKLNNLEERIKDLVEKQKIRETFLISGLVSYVTNFFMEHLASHGDAIIFNEMVLNENPGMELSDTTLKKIKAKNYNTKLKNDYYVWNKIVANLLSEEHFEKWETDDMLYRSKKAQGQLTNMENKFGNMTFKEILEKSDEI